MPVEVAVVAVFSSVGFYIAAVLAVWFVMRSRNERARVNAEVQAKLIERFNSAPELVEFLQSQPGQKFLTGMDLVPRMLAREKIISGVRTSIIFATVGLGLLALCLYPDIRNEFLLFCGGMLMAISVGFLLATFASVKLGRSLGLLNGVQHTTNTTATTES